MQIVLVGLAQVTAKSLKTLLDTLPMRVLKKLDQLSKDSGESVNAIVEYGVDEFERKVGPAAGADKLAELRRDPTTRPLVELVLAAMRSRAHASGREEKSAAGLASATKKWAQKKGESDAAYAKRKSDHVAKMNSARAAKRKQSE